MNVAKFLRTGFFYRTPPVDYTFPKFYAMKEFFGCLWVQNWYFSYFLCHYFFFYNSIRTSIPWLFRTCFHTKRFSECNFQTHYNVGDSNSLIKSLMFMNNSRIKVTSPSNLLWKLWIWVFLILCFAIIAFVFNAKRFAIAILVFFPSRPFYGRTVKRFLDSVLW